MKWLPKRCLTAIWSQASIVTESDIPLFLL